MHTVLTIAGFDPSSGAGVTADLMVFAAHGLFGTSCITALTVQSTLGVAATHPVSSKIVSATLRHLCEDLAPAGIKIGMLATEENVVAVATFLEGYPGIPVVLDPVLRSTSGRELLSPAGLDMLRERLLPLVNVITPNLDELGILIRQLVTTRQEMLQAAHALQRSYPHLTILATGGHLERPDDLLLTQNGQEDWLAGERIVTTSTHGTGCALSSALLCGLVSGASTMQAAQSAKGYVAEALRTAIPIGHGNGPLHLLWPRTLSDSHPKKQENGQ